MSVIRAARAALIGLAGLRVATVTMVVDDHFPKVVIYEAEPFLLELAVSGDKAEAVYRQTRPYRADAMVVDL
jgi:hypothetical protein